VEKESDRGSPVVGEPRIEKKRETKGDGTNTVFILD
jgi:hypothetical protein